MLRGRFSSFEFGRAVTLLNSSSIVFRHRPQGVGIIRHTYRRRKTVSGVEAKEAMEVVILFSSTKKSNPILQLERSVEQPEVHWTLHQPQPVQPDMSCTYTDVLVLCLSKLAACGLWWCSGNTGTRGGAHKVHCSSRFKFKSGHSREANQN